jgi:hypothetical protein
MNISVIIPVHEYNDALSSYLDKAVESIAKQEGIEELPTVVIVAPDDVLKVLIPKISAETHPNISFIKNEGKTDYQSQVNLAVKSITTEYFSVLEFDDEYSLTFFRIVDKYIKAYPEIDIFLTMMIEANDKNVGIKLTNESVWAQQFVGENGEIGYLNLNIMKQYTDFKLSGAVIKKAEFENLGGYKANIKLSFMYEFILRALNNACKIFSIPKIGYRHLAIREGSLSDTLVKEMPINERKFWFEVAQRESNFTGDREIDMSQLKVEQK